MQLEMSLLVHHSQIYERAHERSFNVLKHNTAVQPISGETYKYVVPVVSRWCYDYGIIYMHVDVFRSGSLLNIGSLLHFGQSILQI